MEGRKGEKVPIRRQDVLVMSPKGEPQSNRLVHTQMNEGMAARESR